jgi:hypothetical protein
MPVTPFHFGPGLLGKAVVNRYFSFTSFAITQVVIDVETAYHLVRNEWPLHRAFHTMLLGTAVGVVVGVLLHVVGRIAGRRLWGSVAASCPGGTSARLWPRSSVALLGAPATHCSTA